MSDSYQLPLLTPDSSWVMPRELPDLRNRKLVCIDTEEKDNGLEAGKGPGWAMKSGFVCGVSYATEDGAKGYIPIKHPETECFDKAQVSQWLKDLVKAKTPLLFQNAPFDVGWLWADLDVDIPPEYPIEDTLCAAFMEDENHYEYNLDAICRRLGIPGKDESLLTEAAAAYLRPANAQRSWKLKGKDVKKNLWRLPARYVGIYAEADAMQTLQAFKKMEPVLHEQAVWKAYRLEMDLVPVCRRMKARGIKIDVGKAIKTRDEFRSKVKLMLAEMKRRMPGRGDIELEHLRSYDWLMKQMEMEDIQVPRIVRKNEEGRKVEGERGTFRSAWMEKHPHWLPQMITKVTAWDRFAETFMDKYILGFLNKDRIHPEAHQYKSDDGGTVSYRFAYSNPPLQQAPSADIDPEVGTAFREVFIADGLWGANDYSQQEYRLTAHFAAVAKVRGGEAACKQFQDDPNLDFHKMVAGLTGLTRAKAKIQNFALLYGQGLETTAAALGITEDEAAELRDLVASKAPFGPALDDYCKRTAQNRGYLRLLDGARVRFDEWEAGWMPRDKWQEGKDKGMKMTPCSLAEANERRDDPEHPWHGTRLRRSGVRKALNRLIQGSAARQTKLAMRECAREGLFPILQMHDELDHDEDSEEKLRRVNEIMRTVVPLRLPMKVDLGIGKSWAAAKAKG